MVKVIDTRSAIVNVTLPTRDPGVAAKKEEPMARVVISGVDTAKWADGMPAELPGVFVVVGNTKVGETTYLQLAAIKFTSQETKAILKAAAPGDKK